MAYYNSIRNLLNTGKEFSPIYSLNSTSINTSLNNSTHGFYVGDYLLISFVVSTYSGSQSTVTNSDGYTISGCKLLFADSALNAGSNGHTHGLILYIGQILENNINIKCSMSGGSGQLKVFKLSNNS